MQSHCNLNEANTHGEGMTTLLSLNARHTVSTRRALSLEALVSIALLAAEFTVTISDNSTVHSTKDRLLFCAITRSPVAGKCVKMLRNARGIVPHEQSIC